MAPSEPRIRGLIARIPPGMSVRDYLGEAYRRLQFEELSESERETLQTIIENLGRGSLTISLDAGDVTPIPRLAYPGDLEGYEWLAMFRDILKVPFTGHEENPIGVDIGQRLLAAKESFAQDLPGYPMLGRIWNDYEDVVYSAVEVPTLKFELEKVQILAASDPVASSGVAKLIHACDAAISAGVGVALLSD